MFDYIFLNNTCKSLAYTAIYYEELFKYKSLTQSCMVSCIPIYVNIPIYNPYQITLIA